MVLLAEFEYVVSTVEHSVVLQRTEVVEEVAAGDRVTAVVEEEAVGVAAAVVVVAEVVDHGGEAETTAEVD